MAGRGQKRLGDIMTAWGKIVWGRQRATKAAPFIGQEYNVTPQGEWQKKTPGEVFGAVDWMYRCAMLRGAALGGIPFTVSRGSTVLWDTDTPEPLPKELLPFRALPHMLPLIESAAAVTGRAYIMRQRNMSGADVGARWIPPNQVEPNITSEGLRGFVRTVNGVPREHEIEDFLYFWLPDPMTEIGHPANYPGQSALAAARVLYNMDEYLGAYFKHGMMKAMLYVTKGVIDDASKSALKAWAQKFQRGMASAFNVEVINGDIVTPVPIGDGLKELENAELTKEKREAISTTMGVPQSLVMSNAANYATAQIDLLTLYTNTVLPQARWIEYELNAQKFEGMGLTFEFQPRRIEAIQQEEMKKAEMVQRLTGVPVLLVNEARELLGYDPIVGGDVLPAQFGQRQPNDGELTQPSIEAEPEAKAAERAQFKRWYNKRIGTDVDLFDAHHITKADKLLIADEVLRNSWEAYP